MMKVLKSFEIFPQPDGTVGKLNQPIHWVRFSGMAVWIVWFVCVGSWSFGVGIALCLSFWIPDSVGKVLKIFEIFYPPDGLVGKPNHPIHWVQFSRMAVWVLCFVCIGSWSYGFGIALRFFFWIVDSVRKVMTSFEIFSQPAGSVGKPNQPVHWVKFSETAAWVMY